MKRYTQQDEANGLLAYINHAPTPYHSADYLAALLDEAGAVRLKEADAWDDILPGMIYYFIRNDSALVAFRLGDEPPARNGWRIAAAHHDSPGFRVKPAGSTSKDSYEQLCIMPYGGLIAQTWTDRPLSLAGRVYTRSSYSDDVSGININIDRPLLVIPSLAVHLNRDAGEKVTYNLQTQMQPILAQDFEGSRSFLSMIASEAAVEEEDILSYDLMAYDSVPACYTGLSKEFISAPRLDDYAMVYSVFRGFIESADGGSSNAIAVAFDHEECGSRTDRGAQSDLLESLLARIAEKLDYSTEEIRCSMAHSVLISADMAHATHPSFPECSDGDHPVHLNKGIVLKESANQSYITSPKASAYFRRLCEDHKIPYQVYVNRNDLKGGSTIGPMLASRYGTVCMDIGSPLLSMHAVREFGGTLDVYHATELFETFYE